MLVTDYLGPYELRGELGRGAMAVVWRAYDTSLRRVVALKEAHVPHGTAPATATELSDRFVREARAVAGLSHPNIVTVFSADVYDGRPVIAMELIEGDTLSDLLATGRLAIPAAMGILDQLLDAVGYAHSKGVVHRDIKPENVFVTPDGRVKLTDFGIAHVGAGTALTQAGTVMGTPGYMAPEQVTGSAVDGRADIFSVGVLAYEMLTGSNPFIADGAHPTTVMYRVLNEDLPDVRLTLADAPEELAATIAIATAKDPAQRFSTAEEMKAALRGDVAVAMPRATKVGGATQHTPTSRNLVAGVVALVVVALAGFWVFGSSGLGGSGGSGTGSVAATAAITATATRSTAAAAAQTPVEMTEVKIGIGVPLSAGSVALGKGVRRGAELAIQQANASETIKAAGVTFIAVPGDDEGNSGVGVKVAKDLASDSHLVGVIGHLNSGVSIQAAKIYADKKVAMISPSATNPGLTEQGLANTFRVCTTDAAQGAAAADYATSRLGFQTAYVVDGSITFGGGVAPGFPNRFTANGGRVLGSAKTSEGETDFKDLVNKIKRENPEFIYFSGPYTEGSSLAKQARAAGIEGPMIGDDGLYDPRFITLAGPSVAEGDYATSFSPLLGESQVGTDFKVAYEGAFPGKAISAYDAYAYDATNVLIAAVVDSAKSGGGSASVTTPAGRDRVIKNVAGTNTAGVTGAIAFDSKGDRANAAIALNAVQGGKWTAAGGQ